MVSPRHIANYSGRSNRYHMPPPPPSPALAIERAFKSPLVQGVWKRIGYLTYFQLGYTFANFITYHSVLFAVCVFIIGEGATVALGISTYYLYHSQKDKEELEEKVRVAEGVRVAMLDQEAQERREEMYRWDDRLRMWEEVREETQKYLNRRRR